jgi:hypothetical protein
MEQPRIALSLLLAATVIVVVVASLIIFILRRIPGYRKHAVAQKSATADSERIKAEYAQAGLQVKSSFFSSPSVSGTLSGMAFTHKIVPGGRNSPPRVALSARCALRGEFSVRREGGGETFFKSIGLAGEAQTGDAAFDREFYLAGRSRAYVQAIFSDAQNRDAVRALFALGLDSLELNDGELTAIRGRPPQFLELGTLRGALEQFAALRTTPTALQVAMQGIGGVRTRSIDKACLGAFGVGAGAFMATVYLLEPMVDGQFAMFADSWRQALIVYGMLLAATLLLLRGRANAPRELLMIALLGLPAIWIGGVSGAMLANQYLDSSPPRIVRVSLLRHYVSRGKHSSYHFVFSGWRNADGAVHVVVPLEIYRKARDNQFWRLEMRAGHFGYAWIDSLEPLPKT